MARKRSERPRTDDRKAHFTWEAGDVTITYPEPVKALNGMDEELHTVLWSLEHAWNRAALTEAMVGVAGYLIDHPNDPTVVEALRRAEARLENAT